MKELSKGKNMDLIKFVTDLSWSYCGGKRQDDQYYIELEHYSPLGEDVIDCIWFKEEKAESFLEGRKAYQEDAREKYLEDAELYIKERPKGTEGFSVRELIDDADGKTKQLDDFVEEAQNLYNRIHIIEEREEFIGQIIDIFEDHLFGDTGKAVIVGKKYDTIANELAKMLYRWKVFDSVRIEQ